MSWKAKRDRWATSDGLIRRAIPNLCRDSDSPRQHEDSECNEGEARRTFFFLERQFQQPALERRNS